jgi:chromosome segregation ATPase
VEEKHVTKEVCREKHDNARCEFKSVKEELEKHDAKLREADIRFAELSGDVKHIKDRIDNGLSTTIC